MTSRKGTAARNGALGRPPGGARATRTLSSVIYMCRTSRYLGWSMSVRHRCWLFWSQVLTLMKTMTIYVLHSRMQDDLLDYNLVVVGKTGSGKSWVCNRLLGVRDDRGPFRVYHGMEGQTIMAQSEVIGLRRNRRLHVSTGYIIDSVSVCELSYHRLSLSLCLQKTTTTLLRKSDLWDTASLWSAMTEITHKSQNKAKTGEIKCSANVFKNPFLLLTNAIFKSADINTASDYKIPPSLKTFCTDRISSTDSSKVPPIAVHKVGAYSNKLKN